MNRMGRIWDRVHSVEDKKYVGESVNEEYSTEEKELEHLKTMKYRSVD